MRAVAFDAASSARADPNPTEAAVTEMAIPNAPARRVHLRRNLQDFSSHIALFPFVIAGEWLLVSLDQGNLGGQVIVDHGTNLVLNLNVSGDLDLRERPFKLRDEGLLELRLGALDIQHLMQELLGGGIVHRARIVSIRIFYNCRG